MSINEGLAAAPSSAASVTGTGTVVATRESYIRAVTWESTGTAGTIVIRDGGASGTTVLPINTAAVAGETSMTIPGAGILCSTDIHATLTNVAGLTVVYS